MKSLRAPLSLTEAVRLTQEAGLCFETSVVTDSKNLLSALQVTQLKIPAYKNFIVHLMWLKDKSATGVIDALIWTDTRDMTADGHTKGSIKRTALHALMDGDRRVEDSRSSQARSSGAAGTPGRTEPPHEDATAHLTGKHVDFGPWARVI
jgi:hypothetical protein